MSYRIEYQKSPVNRKNIKYRLRLPFLTFICFLLFVYLVGSMWPEGSVLVRKVIRPCDRAIAVSALNTFAVDLHNGKSILSAFFEFCRNFLS